MNDQNSHESSGDTSESKEKKIHLEEVKGRHTTHWDRDYLPTEEVDAAYREGQSNDEGSATGDNET